MAEEVIEDGLAIAPGAGQGEAYILPQSTFDPVQFSQRSLSLIEGRNAKRRAAEALKAKRAQDFMGKIKNPVAEWDADSIEYFSPKLKSRQEKINKYVASGNGYPTDAQVREIENETADLNQDVELSNAQKKVYDDVIKKVYTKKDQKDLFSGDTQLNVAAWGYPTRNKDHQFVNAEGEETTVGKELAKYGNDPVKFRAANRQLVEKLDDAWYLDDQAQQIAGRVKPIQQDAITAGYVGPFKGVFNTQTKGYTEDQINTIEGALRKENPQQFSSQVRELTNYLDDKAKAKIETQAGIEAGILNKEGKVDQNFVNRIREESAKEVQQNAPADATPGEINDAVDMLARQKMVNIMNGAYESKLFKTYWKNRYPNEVDKKFNEANKANSSGGGGGFTDKYTVTTTPYTTGGGVKAFNEKYDANVPENLQRLGTHKNAKIVAIEPTAKGADTESFQLSFNGKQVRPVHYIVDKDSGKIYGVFSERVPDPNDSEKKIDQVKEYELKDRELVNIAAQYGFGGNDGIAKFKKEALGMGSEKDYGNRPDGTIKDVGFLGELKLPNGGVATEYSVQSDAVKQGGKRIDFPTLVPTLTKEEVHLMTNDIIPNNKPIPESIMQKAIAHAKKRISEDKPVFYSSAQSKPGKVDLSKFDKTKKK